MLAVIDYKSIQVLLSNICSFMILEIQHLSPISILISSKTHLYFEILLLSLSTLPDSTINPFIIKFSIFLYPDVFGILDSLKI